MKRTTCHEFIDEIYEAREKMQRIEQKKIEAREELKRRGMEADTLNVFVEGQMIEGDGGKDRPALMIHRDNSDNGGFIGRLFIPL